MSLVSGLKVATQRPLDEVRVVKNVASISTLGTDNYLAYLYYMNLIVHCLEENRYYQWREVANGEEGTGLIGTDFTYPNGIIEYGIDYSGKLFNFFPIIDASGITLSNLGTGAKVYKDITFPLPGIKQFNLRSIILKDATVGVSLIKGITEGANEITQELKVFETETLVVDLSDPNKIRINLPSSNSLSDFYVRKDAEVTYFDWLVANTQANGGTPVIGYEYKGFGTIAKPFVDTITYTLGAPATPPTVDTDTAIDNAFIAYIGTGNALTPQYGGRRIRLQPAVTIHVYESRFNINGLVFTVETGAALYHTNVATSGEEAWLVNLDHSSLGTSTPIGITIELEPNSTIHLARNGFKNKGTNIITNNFITSKQIVIRNNGGIIHQTATIEAGDIAGTYLMFDGNAAGTTGYKNDGNALISVIGGNITSVINPIFKGGGHVSDFTDVEFEYGQINKDVDVDIAPFESAEGLYTRMENCRFYVFGNQTTKRLFKCVGNSQFLVFEPLINGTVEALAEIIIHPTDHDLDPVFVMYNAVNKDGFVCTDTIFKVNLGVRVNRWKKNYFNNNYISKGSFDQTKVDMTGGNYQGVMNFIGRPTDYAKQISMILPRFGTRVAAASIMPVGTQFINTNGMPITNSPDATWKVDIVL